MTTSKSPDQLVAARWRSEVLARSYTWPTTGLVMPSGRRRGPFRLLQAMFTLADEARADGALKGLDKERESYWWLTLKQLAEKMRMSKSIAKHTLDWLEREGWLGSQEGRVECAWAALRRRAQGLGPTPHFSTFHAEHLGLISDR
jgi:DNA-binding IclR family transcriptional regulator